MSLKEGGKSSLANILHSRKYSLSRSTHTALAALPRSPQSCLWKQVGGGGRSSALLCLQAAGQVLTSSGELPSSPSPQGKGAVAFHQPAQHQPGKHNTMTHPEEFKMTLSVCFLQEITEEIQTMYSCTIIKMSLEQELESRCIIIKKK